MANSSVWGWCICEAELPCDSEAKNDSGRAGCGKTARPVRRGGTESGLDSNDSVLYSTVSVVNSYDTGTNRIQ